ncbi:MAG: hypothetical protein L3K23_02065 [Thermoplasmata archaeon]|nr:hypothetical protein [Thermoplasmata archaeon]
MARPGSVRLSFGRALLVGGALVLTLFAALSSAPSSGTASGPTTLLNFGEPAVSPSSAATYPVNFTEHGLPQGAAWNLTLLGHTWNSTASSLQLVESNGSFSYSAASAAFPGNWSANGTFVVAGKGVTVLVLLTTPSPSHAPTAGAAATQPLAPSFWLFTAGFLVVVVVAVAVGIAARRRKGDLPRPPTPPTSSLPPPVVDATVQPPASDDSDPLSHML